VLLDPLVSLGIEGLGGLLVLLAVHLSVPGNAARSTEAAEATVTKDAQLIVFTGDHGVATIREWTPTAARVSVEGSNEGKTLELGNETLVLEDYLDVGGCDPCGASREGAGEMENVACRHGGLVVGLETALAIGV
jgi:hypothetical protein